MKKIKNLKEFYNTDIVYTKPPYSLSVVDVSNLEASPNFDQHYLFQRQQYLNGIENKVNLILNLDEIEPEFLKVINSLNLIMDYIRNQSEMGIMTDEQRQTIETLVGKINNIKLYMEKKILPLFDGLIEDGFNQTLKDINDLEQK